MTGVINCCYETCPTSFFVTRFFVDILTPGTTGKQTRKCYALHVVLLWKLLDVQGITVVVMELSLPTPMPNGAPTKATKAGSRAQYVGKTVHDSPKRSHSNMSHFISDIISYCISYFMCVMGGGGELCGGCSAGVTPSSSQCLLNSHPIQPVGGQPVVFCLGHDGRKSTTFRMPNWGLFETVHAEAGDTILEISKICYQ